MQKLTRQVIVPDKLAGKRLDQAAAQVLPEFSRSRIQQWIQGGQLTLNGATTEAKRRVHGGEQLDLKATLEPLSTVGPEQIPLNVVYEDSEVIVIDKPAGLVVHPGAGNITGTLQNALLAFDAALAAVPRAGLVHRLDKDTSGLLVVARNLTAQSRLAEQIQHRSMARVYQAVCQTALTGGGVVDAPIDRHSRERKRMAVREPGRPARTHYTVVERFRAHTHIEVRLETGRTHQIRVHMAHIQAPLVGDPVYGGRPRLPRQPTEALKVELQSFPRQALHAVELVFEHPRSLKRMSFASEIPADIAALLGALREDNERAPA